MCSTIFRTILDDREVFFWKKEKKSQSDWPLNDETSELKYKNEMK